MSAAKQTNCRATRNASRSSFTPGFYRALNASDESDIPSCPANLSLPALSSAGESNLATELPPGCYLVERVVAMKSHKVSLLSV